MKKLIGDKNFYKKVFAVAIPIMLQNGISNFVGLLDNIMVGRLGTEQMSGVSIVNQLIFVFFLCLFGAIGGVGIFTAQYAGQKNDEGIRYTFRFKMLLGLIILALFCGIFITMDTQLISLYLHEGSKEGNLALTLECGKQYMAVMLIGLIPCIFEQVYSSTMRECGETVVPMVASVIAVFVNLVFNYVFIFGHFGFKPMGVVGAALATNISRVLQAVIVIVYTHTHIKKFTYITGVFKSLKVPYDLIKKMLYMATPLVFNETLWAAGIAIQTQIYSARGLSVVAGLNINSTIYNVFNIAFIAMGDAVAIIVGQLLGAGKLDEAKDTAYKIIAFSTVMCVVIGTILYLFAPVFPRIYNTTQEVMDIATGIIRISAIMMPVSGFLHATYFTIRSGGKTLITFLFDSVFLWLISVPVAYILIYMTGVSIFTAFFIVEGTNIVKSFIGWLIMKSGVWRQNIVGEK
ncbi:MAG: MATE family efflux transporter [Lachnospiraceae bacterium]|nr:MATE family efflux transporter [Lachnospiraceae bacterium]